MNNSFESNPGVSEGKFFERALLGDTKYEKRLEFNHELEKLLQTYEKTTTREGFIENERIQPPKGTPASPEKQFPSQLANRIRTKLKIRGLTNLKDSDVKYYTSVGYSPLDDYNGIDAYFRVNLPDGERIITIDVSLKDKPEDNIRADIFRQFSNTVDEGDEEWEDSISKISIEIADKLLSSKPLKMEEPNIMKKYVHKIPWAIIKNEKENLTRS